MNTKQRVSDIIPIADIEEWRNDEIVIIEAGTGAGKSYFIKNVLYEYAKSQGKKILFLIHRSDCRDNFKAEIERDGKTDVIDLKTYQAIEQNVFDRNQHFSYDEYMYIVCDEFHYFISDAAYNKTTDISFNEIISQKNAVKIFMSATGEDMEQYINMVHSGNIRKYSLPRNYSYINQLVMFNKDEDIITLAECFIRLHEKAMFFIQSAEKAYSLYRQFKDHALFNCSKSNRKYRKYIDTEKISAMLTNERFDETILITTSCFDAGANIVDTEIKHIIVDITDIGSLIQCVGRKRIQSDADTFSLYVKNIPNQRLSGLRTSAMRNIEMADCLLKSNEKELIEKYPRQVDMSCIIYDTIENDVVVKKVNMLMYYKKKSDVLFYEYLMGLKHGYCDYIKEYFQQERFESMDIDHSIETFLKEYAEKEIIMYQQKDRIPLIDKLGVKSKNRKRLKSREAQNAYLKEVGLPYMIHEFRASRVIDGKCKRYRSAWKVIKLE